MVKSRIEKDFLGEKEIPNEAYYGVQTLRAVENFPITGFKLNNELIRAMAMVKKAAAQANMELGFLSKEIGKAIAEASEEIIQGKLHEQFIVDPFQGGAGTSINMNTNEVIANRSLELLGKERGDYYYLSPNSHVNMSQSTNDSFPTAFRIATLRLLEELLDKMQNMYQVFSNKALEFDPVIKLGRTHLQDAVPIRLGQEFEAYKRVLGRDIERIANSRKHLYEVNLGATAVGTGLNANRSYIKYVVQHLAEISGFSLVSADHLVDATQNTDAYTEVSGALKICMMNMSKIANDLRLMASGPRLGLNEINLPARQPGSSIMPGKVNPVMPELVNQVAFQVIGNDHTISLASEAGQFELNVMEPVLVFNLIQSISMMTNTFRVFTEFCLEGIEANSEKLKEDVERSVGIITAVNPHLGYETTAQLAREAILTGESIRKLCSTYIPQENMDLILNAYEMTNPGIAGETLLKKIDSDK